MAKNEIEYSARNGMATISTANSNLDGTGTIDSLITGDQNGIRIERIYIKATGNVSQGMIRLFLYDLSNTRLIKEIPVKSVNQSGVNPAFSKIIRFPEGLILPYEWALMASTQNAESFNIVVQGMSWDYPVSETKIETTAANSVITISTANSNLDGTGTLTTLITGANNGTRIKNIIVKATGSSSHGMVRLFLYDGSSTTKLFMEIPITESAQYATVSAFMRKINFRGNGFLLKPGWSIKASTQVAETFAITANAESWNYV